MKTYKILIPIILLTFFLRVWHLPETPPGLWYDEAYYSMDAAWLLDGGPWSIFFVGNNGREPMFIYLQSLFIWLFGAAPLTSRLIAPLAGTLTIPLMFVLARRLTRRLDRSTLIAYVATMGLAASFWHVGLSRGGYRGILLPLVAVFVFYAFWRAWQGQSLKFMILAGLALGISQYTYLAARALPLTFAAFAFLWTALTLLRRQSLKPQSQVPIPQSQTPNSQFSILHSQLSILWLTLTIMALLSAIVFAPLGWIFYNNPSLFSARTGDVFFTPDTLSELLSHLSQAVRLFIDNGDPNWRHHLPGRPMLGWLGWLGFWPGLILCLRRWRQPAPMFLLVALLTLYLPALLSVPPVHALRLATLLPIYYIIFAIGLVWLVAWLVNYALRTTYYASQRRAIIIPLLIVLLLLETTLTTYDYFVRWANAEETYVEYNTPLVDFIDHVADLTRESPVILPFQIYVHPTTRYLLHDQFTEQLAPDTLSGPVKLVTLPDNFRMLNVANIPELPAYVWLARTPDGQGVVYVSRPPRLAEQAYLRQAIQTVEPESYLDRFGRSLADFRTLPDPTPLLPMFTDTTPQRVTDINWADQAQLIGYEVIPEVAQPNQPITLNLYWRSLTDLTFDSRLFLQIVDSAGNPINQWEGEAFREDMYRWRPNGILPTQHTLWLGPDTPPGPYLIRLGFFDRHTGERLPIQAINGAPVTAPNGDTPEPIDQIHLGLFYVTPDGADPRSPALPLSATFADSIQLTGLTFPESPNLQSPNSNLQSLPMTFHWQSLQPTAKPYTVFLQLLNQNGEVVSGWDSQPFNGLYPTSRWSPGEIVVDTFTLPLPENGLPPGSYRLITGFYDFDTGQRLLLPDGADFVVVSEFSVE
ncbi:MAG: glycosyltransferase family 39 protein [Anaerolineales bacterium]|nr:glycosyltransferase family 39 protein [Anaerolineales bacterium]